VEQITSHYKYKKKTNKGVMIRTKPRVAVDKEQLMGSVRGMKASSLEERFAKALDKRNIDYYFRLSIGAPRGLPGWKELDFLVVNGGYYPIEIEDTTFIHHGTTAEDMLKDAQTVEYLKMYNPFPVKHVDQTRLGDDKMADLVVKELFL
jgi:hypothetical protein